jgi:hypothetical protein
MLLIFISKELVRGSLSKFISKEKQLQVKTCQMTWDLGGTVSARTNLSLTFAVSNSLLELSRFPSSWVQLARVCFHGTKLLGSGQELSSILTGAGKEIKDSRREIWYAYHWATCQLILCGSGRVAERKSNFPRYEKSHMLTWITEEASETNKTACSTQDPASQADAGEESASKHS